MQLINHQINQPKFSQKGEQSMKLVKYLLIITMIIVCASFGYATKYSSAGGQGTSTVGATLSDYTSLYDAAQDFNATANTGNWTLEITTDLSEVTSCFFMKTLGAGTTFTIKPAVGTQPTVTFLQAGDNIVSSHMLIGGSLSGLTTSGGAMQSAKMDGFTIDGSNNGTDSRDLTFINVRGSTGNLAYARLVYILGDSDNVMIKNCNFINLSTNASNNQYCIAFGTLSTLAPDNWTVQNCFASNTVTDLGMCVGSFNAGFTPTGTAQTGWLITNNFLYGVKDVVRIQNGSNGTITDNRIWVKAPNGMQGGRIINHEFANGANDWTITIKNNTFDFITCRNVTTGTAGTNLPQSISWGVSGIVLQGNGTNCNYDIYNNMMCGFTFSSAAICQNYHAVIVLSTTANVNLFYNSINMPNFDGFQYLPGKCYAFGLSTSTPPVPYTGTLTMKNNIVRQAQVGGSVLYIYDATVLPQIVSDYNDWFTSDTNPVIAYVGGSTLTTLNDWKTFSGKDANSQSIDPLATSPDHWTYSTTSTGAIIPPTDLHFTGPNPAPLTPGTPITSPIAITTDFDGNARSLTAPWKGCDEIITALIYSPTIIYTRPGEAAIPLTVSGGIPPYNWVVNGGVGTLDMSTGTAVLFTPATTAATGDITVTDGAAQTAIIPVSVTPTSAPLFNDAMETKQVRFEIFE
jgi:hypothetical protein